MIAEENVENNAETQAKRETKTNIGPKSTSKEMTLPSSSTIITRPQPSPISADNSGQNEVNPYFDRNF